MSNFQKNFNKVYYYGMYYLLDYTNSSKYYQLKCKFYQLNNLNLI